MDKLVAKRIDPADGGPAEWSVRLAGAHIGYISERRYNYVYSRTNDGGVDGYAKSRKQAMLKLAELASENAGSSPRGGQTRTGAKLSMFRIGPLLTLRAADGDEPLKATDAGYGWCVEPDHKEWAIVVQYTSRQDGRTSYACLLTDCDGVARVRSGLVKTDDIAPAIGLALKELSLEARWLQPIEVEIA